LVDVSTLFDCKPGVLGNFIAQLENDASLAEPGQLRQRLDALDRLDAYVLPEVTQEFSRRAKVIRDGFEALNAELYEAIRCEIQCGLRPDNLLRWLPSSLHAVNGESYDYLDELISGVLRLEEPEDECISREPEALFYQPTPARHIFSLIGLTALTADDVFVDIGSGLGHVPMLVSSCTEASSIGLELEGVYADRARQCAQRLNLNQVTFIQQDAREADFSSGTVFYLYTPFVGSILSAVLGRLRREAAARRIRICSYGPCTPAVAEESWLAASTPLDPNRITVFRS
jgi:hypothetical protein